MQNSNHVEKIQSRKTLAWYEEGQGRKGDKRNKIKRNRDEKRSFIESKEQI